MSSPGEGGTVLVESGAVFELPVVALDLGDDVRSAPGAVFELHLLAPPTA
ncbi:hypothetical protein H7X46_26080 [Pseudonocardia sp. C8]|nr:hypothetical protein [Pseudonocardia sp. C8]MBC3194521.1 hypothetical protein [Pseudonocardia sp. C8]